MRLKTAASVSLAIAGAALAGFHGWLFVAQIAAGRLDDPWEILRWVVASSLVASLVALHRRGESVFGRKAIAIWALAALLHIPTVAKNSPLELRGLPETTVASVLRMASAAGVGASLWLLAALWLARRRSLDAIAILSDAQPFCRRLDVSRTRSFAPRPPPARVSFAA